MSNRKITERGRELFLSRCPELERQLYRLLAETINDLAARNIPDSSIARDNISQLMEDELNIRSDLIWDCMSRSVEAGGLEDVGSLGNQSGRRSSRQGCNSDGESPAVSVARVGYVVMPHLGAGNQPS